MATYNINSSNTTSTLPPYFNNGDVINFSYTRRHEYFILPPGEYYITAVGAAGGARSGYTPGYGAMVRAYFYNHSWMKCYMVVGGAGTYTSSSGYDNRAAGGYNGGGYGYTTVTGRYMTSGGGATDLRLGMDSLFSRVIVAGGGGGANDSDSSYKGGNAGVWSGSSGTSNNMATRCGGGGTLYGGGSGGYESTFTAGTYLTGSFGQGGQLSKNTSNSIYTNGGGGGWFGGGGSGPDAGAGGGSSFVLDASVYSSFRNNNSTVAYLLDPTLFVLQYNNGSSGYNTGNGYASITVNRSYVNCAAYVKHNDKFVRLEV